ncbi:MAG: hypothetical protein HQM01_06230, partial [Magnetococcales bacterium]|nr:hypothetical protein [Magnetococcales bacterium]
QPRTVHQPTGGAGSEGDAVSHPASRFSHDPVNRDVGLIQSDPLEVDLAATRAALRALHADWPGRVAEERHRMAAWRPDLILGNIPYLSIQAGAELAIPTVALTSLTWDRVMAAYFQADDPEISAWCDTMRQAYGRASLALRATPALPDHPFPEAVEIPPVTTLGINRRAELRWQLQIDRSDTRPLVLVTLGGIPAARLPVAALRAHRDFHWLIDRQFDHGDHACHLHPVNAIKRWPFADLSASVDLIVSKPGYGMAVTAAAHGLPFAYVRRGTFPDEEPILSWCDQNNRIAEISREAFEAGRFPERLHELLARPAPPRPAIDGAEVGAKILLERYLG